jgi:hypothetical protein
LAGTVLLVAGAMIAPWNLSLPMVLVAIAIAAGTLLGLSWFQQGATERAIYSLAATWTLILLVLTGWVVPKAEPYRTSRIVGERLASLSSEMRLEPVLLEYQEPGLFYALGRWIATTRDRDSFFSHLQDGRSVLTVALASDLEIFHSKFGLVVTPVDQVEGFVLSKGRKQVLQLAVVRQGDSVEAASPASASAAAGNRPEQTLVK